MSSSNSQGDVNLTIGAITQLHGYVNNLKPILQILRIKGIDNPPQPHDPLRVLISDSDCYMDCYLVGRYNAQFANGELCENSVVQLLKYEFRRSDTNSFVYIQEIQILVSRGKKIGNPTGLRLGFPLEPGPALQPQLLDLSTHQVTPFSGLGPHVCDWVIKARVTAKGSLCTYKTELGNMNAFYFDLIDLDASEMRVKCTSRVNETDYGYYENVKVGNVYFISNGRLNPVVNFEDSYLKSEYEIFLDGTSKMQICEQDDNRIPKVFFTILRINEIKKLNDGSIVDITGVAKALGPPEFITCKNGSKIVKRVLTFYDPTGDGKLTLRGPESCYVFGESLSNSLALREHVVFAVKACRLINSSTVSVETISSTKLILDPTMRAAYPLKRWRQNNVLGDVDDVRLLTALSHLNASRFEDVLWDNLLEDRTGAMCQGHWKQLVQQISKHHGELSFYEELEVLVELYCPNLLGPYIPNTPGR